MRELQELVNKFVASVTTAHRVRSGQAVASLGRCHMPDARVCGPAAGVLRRHAAPVETSASAAGVGEVSGAMSLQGRIEAEKRVAMRSGVAPWDDDPEPMDRCTMRTVEGRHRRWQDFDTVNTLVENLQHLASGQSPGTSAHGDVDPPLVSSGQTGARSAESSSAYFYADSSRDIYVMLPTEDQEAGDEQICGSFPKRCTVLVTLPRITSGRAREPSERLASRLGTLVKPWRAL